MKTSFVAATMLIVLGSLIAALGFLGGNIAVMAIGLSSIAVAGLLGLRAETCAQAG